MRKSLALLLTLFFILISGLACQAAPEKLQKYFLWPWSEEPGIRLQADIFGDGNPLDIRAFNQEKVRVVIQFYSGSELVDQFIPKVSPTFITKAHLRDDRHEEIIGFSGGGTLFTLVDLFILGTDDQGNITYLPINKKLKYILVSPNLKTDGKDLLIPFLNPYDTKITIRWDPKQQIFIATDDRYKIPKEEPRIPAPEVLSENEKTLGGFRLADRHLGKDDGVYNPKTWEHSYRYGDVLFNTSYVLHYINLIVVDGPSVETARGVKVGDPAAKVIKKYGEPLVSEYDGLLLYEYATLTSYDYNAVLRFAINKDSNTVEYISLRWN